MGLFDFVKNPIASFKKEIIREERKVSKAISNVTGSINSTITKAKDDISAQAARVINTVGSTVHHDAAVVGSFISNAATKVDSGIAGIGSSVSSVVGTVGRTIDTTVASVDRNILNTEKSVVDTINAGATSFARTAEDFANDVSKPFLDANKFIEQYKGPLLIGAAGLGLYAWSNRSSIKRGIDSTFDETMRRTKQVREAVAGDKLPDIIAPI